MIDEIKKIFNTDFPQHRTSIRETSKDGDSNYLSSLSKIVYDYDKVVQDLRPKYEYCSPDAFCFSKNDELVFIEFKNQKINHPNSDISTKLQYNLRLKCVEGLLALGVILKGKGKISEINEVFQLKDKINYMIVYSSDKNNQHNLLGTGSSNRTHQTRYNVEPSFTLERYRKIIVNEIVVVNNDKFDQHYLDLLINNS